MRIQAAMNSSSLSLQLVLCDAARLLQSAMPRVLLWLLKNPQLSPAGWHLTRLTGCLVRSSLSPFLKHEVWAAPMPPSLLPFWEGGGASLRKTAEPEWCSPDCSQSCFSFWEIRSCHQRDEQHTSLHQFTCRQVGAAGCTKHAGAASSRRLSPFAVEVSLKRYSCLFHCTDTPQ